MTKNQLILLHKAAAEAGINPRPGHDGEWRMILRNIGKVESAKDLTNERFEDVMAVLEERGFKMPGQSPTHFRDKVDNRGRYASARAVHFIYRLAQETGYTRGLSSLCQRFSHDRTGEVSKLTPQEAYGLTEMLKAKKANPAPDKPKPTGISEPTLFPLPSPEKRTGLPDTNVKTKHAGASPAPTPEPDATLKGDTFVRTPAGRAWNKPLEEEDIPF